MTRDPVRWLPRRGTGAEVASEPPFDPSSWSGALVVMTAVTAALWVVQIVNAAHSQSFDRFGLQPRRLDGLWGVLTAPALHSSYGHMLSETVPLLGVGWLLMLSGLRAWLLVSGLVLVIGGLATWLVAPSGVVLGASGLIFGWLGYLLARAYFTRKVRWIVAALVVLFFFGTLLNGLLPSIDEHASWQSHLCSFLAGVLVAAILHPRTHRQPRRRAG